MQKRCKNPKIFRLRRAKTTMYQIQAIQYQFGRYRRIILKITNVIDPNTKTTLYEIVETVPKNYKHNCYWETDRPTPDGVQKIAKWISKTQPSETKQKASGIGKE